MTSHSQHFIEYNILSNVTGLQHYICKIQFQQTDFFSPRENGHKLQPCSFLRMLAETDRSRQYVMIRPQHLCVKAYSANSFCKIKKKIKKRLRRIQRKGGCARVHQNCAAEFRLKIADESSRQSKLGFGSRGVCRQRGRERERESERRERKDIARKGDQQNPRSTYGRLQMPRAPLTEIASPGHIHPSLARLIINTPRTILKSRTGVGQRSTEQLRMSSVTASVCVARVIVSAPQQCWGCVNGTGAR